MNVQVRNRMASWLNSIAWLLGALVIVSSVGVWLGGVDPSKLTPYDIFPLLGLLAFGLMWTHYVLGALRRYAGVGRKTGSVYRTASMGLVLALLLLHPGILIAALYLDGYGLPPQSYLQVYASEAGFLLLGTLALVIFLTYELHRFFKRKTWWRYVERLQLLAMGLIFIHAIGLGGELSVDWFMLVWIFYGVSFVIATVYISMWDNERKGKI